MKRATPYLVVIAYGLAVLVVGLATAGAANTWVNRQTDYTVPTDIDRPLIVMNYDQVTNVPAGFRLDITYRGFPGTVADRVADCEHYGGRPIAPDATTCADVDY